jgi:hypothetical protein
MLGNLLTQSQNSWREQKMNACGAMPCACTTTHLGIRIPKELLAAVERAAGRRRTSEFVRAALAEKLSRDGQAAK